MTCFLQQYTIMTSVFWLTFISLQLLHLVVISQILILSDPLKRNEAESTCLGTGLVVDVDRLFLSGKGSSLSNNISNTPNVLFQQRLNSQQRWNLVCRIYLRNCKSDNNTKCGCFERGNDGYGFHLNMTVRLHMNQSVYRLTWLDGSQWEIHSETRKIPKVWQREYDYVKSQDKVQSLKRDGKCEILFEPNTPFSYCIRNIEKPFLVKIISWNESPSEIVSSEIISQHCVNTSGFSESGGLLEYTEITGCQRRKSRYCTLKVTAKESPPACKEEEMRKGSVNLTIKNHTIDVPEGFCGFILREGVNVSVTVCIQETQPPYNVTIVLGNHVMELTNFPQDCVSLYHTPSAATFQPNYQFIFIDRCQNNVTLICSAILFANQSSGRAGEDGNDGKRNSLSLTALTGILITLSILPLTVIPFIFLWRRRDEAVKTDQKNEEGIEQTTIITEEEGDKDDEKDDAASIVSSHSRN